MVMRFQLPTAVAAAIDEKRTMAPRGGSVVSNIVGAKPRFTETEDAVLEEAVTKADETIAVVKATSSKTPYVIAGLAALVGGIMFWKMR